MAKSHKPSVFPQSPSEPLFVAISEDDPEIVQAHARVARSIGLFKSQVTQPGDHICSAKLRFRDPDRSEERGEDQFFFLWLTNTYFHPNEGMFSAEFFEVPEHFAKWHPVGERLAFDPEDIFDWMVNDKGHIHGGFTLRVNRSRLTSEDQAAYDEFVGATTWEPLPNGWEG